MVAGVEGRGAAGAEVVRAGRALLEACALDRLRGARDDSLGAGMTGAGTTIGGPAMGSAAPGRGGAARP
ncbi:hypothetical protein AB0J80_15200 [Actinoplanes sp. NPDC049548]|uniref:hypothetical protein n=1 Tax=Actinoplanes sp. NPDC049548 TaxID=3155152 RepID=UPI00342353F8